MQNADVDHKGSHHLKKLGFYEKLSQNGDPRPPYCICEILIQIFTVNEHVYNN